MSGLIRRVNAEGGFATVLARGERDAGTLLVVLRNGNDPVAAHERMPQLDGTRKWSVAKAQTPENPQDFDTWLERRRGQDPDLWIVELDAPDATRFIDEA